MSKIVAYSCLLYGACYLEAAVRSIINDVDEYFVLYTDVGSHGHQASTPSPDSEATLHAIAERSAGSKLRWINGRWGTEGQQRDYIQVVAPDADIVVPLDYDEVWEEGLLWRAIDATRERPDIRRWRIPFRHYYRSFYWCILHDPAYPHRVYNMRAADGEATLDTSLAVNHFGYAIPPALMRFKWEVHGHKNELRHDVNYFADVYEANRRTDCHPCGNVAWNAEWVQPFMQPFFLPEYMVDHPYAKLEVIE